MRMERDPRRAFVAVAVALFAVGLAFGFVIGRAAEDDVRVDPSPSPSIDDGEPSPTAATPSLGQEPALDTRGRVLREGDRPVVVATAAAPCQTLITPGILGECGEVAVGDTRVVWVVERAIAPNATTAHTARLFTFVPDAGGWVEWLQASDPVGERWTDVNVVPADLTGDGVQELLVGFRGTDELSTLEYDIVGYGQQAVPQVLAHPDASPLGAVVVSAGQIQEFAAQFPNGEPPCCPPQFLRSTIAFEEGFFRVTSSAPVLPNAVPASQL
jgi:hypothetical protein